MINDQYLGLALAMIGGFLPAVALMLILLPRRRKQVLFQVADLPKPIPYASAVGSRPEAPWVTREEFDKLAKCLEQANVARNAQQRRMNDRLATIAAAQKPGSQDGVRVWGLDEVSTHYRLWDGWCMWARGADEPGQWFRDTTVHTPHWCDRHVPELHGPERDEVVRDWMARNR